MNTVFPYEHISHSYIGNFAFPLIVYFYHNKRKPTWIHILPLCWWNLLTSANQIARRGSCDRSRIHVHELGGAGVWPVKIKICDNMTRYLIILITFLSQNKVEKKIKKNIDETMLQLGIPGHDNCLFIYGLVWNLQQNNWCYEMYDHLKGFIFRFNLNF